MATVNPRLNVTLGKETMRFLSTLAKKDGKSVSAKAAEMISEMLAMQEDMRDSKIADERLARAKKFYSHEDAWGSLAGE